MRTNKARRHLQPHKADTEVLFLQRAGDVHEVKVDQVVVARHTVEQAVLRVEPSDSSERK